MGSLAGISPGKRVRAVLGAALVAGSLGGVVALGVAGVAGVAGASSAATLYVAPGGSPSNGDTSCTTAGYSSIQTAVDAATAGDTVQVCPGTYDEQVVVDVSGLTIEGSGATTTIVDPTTSTPATVTDALGGQVVPVVDVTGATTVTIGRLTVTGSGLSAAFGGCGVGFVGVLYKDASGALSQASVRGVELPTTLFGCQAGTGVRAESSSLTVTHTSVATFDKNGIACVGTAAACTVSHDTVRGVGPTGAIAQNGVEFFLGATGGATHDSVSTIDYTGSSGPPSEPQATDAAGVLVYDAATVGVGWNLLSNDQIGVEVVHSNAAIAHNMTSQTPGIATSVGVFAVACDIYCPYFGLTGATSFTDPIVQNRISFPGAPTPGTVGIWLNESGANTGSGTVSPTPVKNTVTGATTAIRNTA